MKRLARHRAEIFGLIVVAAVVVWISVPDSGPTKTTSAQIAEAAGPTDCTKVVGSLEAAQSAVSDAPEGSVICLSDGEFGKLNLHASKRSPGVTLRAEHPGEAAIDGVSMAGRNLTVARFKITSDVEIQPGSTGMSVNYNRIGGGYFGIDAGPTDDVTVNDVSIIGNKFVGPYGEDAIRLNRYHDANGDGIGILIEGNEITGVVENGSHSDCLQSVWVGDHMVFRRNYLHDNRCQGFFVKDQASPIHGIVVNNNLFLRDGLPCAPSASGCGQPAVVQIFGPYTGLKMIHNTVWDRGNQVAFQEGSSPDTVIQGNVMYKAWTNTQMEGIYRDNTRCIRESAEGGSWPRQTPGEKVTCNPHFRDPKVDDYRLEDGRGVNWTPASQHYGP
jgi:hypothetical protein